MRPLFASRRKASRSAAATVPDTSGPGSRNSVVRSSASRTARHVRTAPGIVTPTNLAPASERVVSNSARFGSSIRPTSVAAVPRVAQPSATCRPLPPGSVRTRRRRITVAGSTASVSACLSSAVLNPPTTITRPPRGNQPAPRPSAARWCRRAHGSTALRKPRRRAGNAAAAGCPATRAGNRH